MPPSAARRRVLVAIALFSVLGAVSWWFSRAPQPTEAVASTPPAELAVRLESVRAFANDESGRFAWIDDERSAAVSLVAAPADVALRARSGDLSFRVSKDPPRIRLELTEPSELGDEDQIEVVVRGEIVDTLRIRRVDLDGDSSAARFWRAVRDADALWKPNAPAAARAWVRLATLEDASIAEGEAARMLRAAAFFEQRELRFVEALELLRRADTLTEAVQDELGRARIAFYEGEIAHGTGAHLRAFERYDAALARAEAVGAEDDAKTYALRKAVALAEVGRHGDALAALPKDAADRPRASYDSNAAWVRFLAMKDGVIAWDFDVLREGHRRAAAYFLREDDLASAGNQLARLAALDLLAGDVPAARRGLEGLAPYIPHLPGYARPFVTLLEVRVAIAEDRFEDATTRIQALLGGSTDTESPERCRAVALLGEIAERRGALDDAIETYRRAARCVDEIDDGFTSLTAHALFRYAERDVRTKLARALVRAGRNEEALGLVDRERAWVLERHLRALDIDAHPDAWFAYQSARAIAERLALEGCAAAVFEDEERACTETIATARRDAVDALAAFERELPKRSSTVRDEAWVERLQAALGPRRALLVVVGEQTSAQHLFVTDTAVEAISGDPLERLDGRRRLFVVPDWHPSSYDPFAATTADGPLAARVSLRLLPHADALLAATGPTGDHPLVVADPDRTLPRSHEEGRWVASHFDAPRPLFGDDATRAAILERWSDASLVHYAGHADGRPGDPWSVVLRIADEQDLTIFDLFLAVRQPKLVVLNGCATGPALRAGGGGFPAALVYAGVQNVLTTTEPQADGSATAFLRDFYESGGALDAARAFPVAVRKAIEREDDVWRIFRLWGVGTRPAPTVATSP